MNSRSSYIPPARSTPRQPLNWQIEQLPGLSAADCELLQSRNITTTRQLCQQTATPAACAQLAQQLAIPVRHVQKWAALASLAQIPSVGCQYCGLLLHIGIASPAQLAQTSLQRLHQQVLRLQVSLMQRPDLCPSASVMQHWIAQAQQMQRSVRPPLRPQASKSGDRAKLGQAESLD